MMKPVKKFSKDDHLKSLSVPATLTFKVKVADVDQMEESPQASVFA